MTPSGGVTSVELMTALGHIYGFEVRGGAETGASVGADLLTDLESEGGIDEDETTGRGSSVGSSGSARDNKTPDAGSSPVPGPSNIGEDKSMAKKEKKKCRNGCDKLAQIDGLCYRCYTREHGKGSWPYTKSRKSPGGVVKPKASKDAENAVREEASGTPVPKLVSTPEPVNEVKRIRFTVMQIETEESLPQIAELMTTLGFTHADR